ncbi:response regulator [Marivirga sp. S37H4]|uniref:histidine kinase n=1 Tax=Marivirga aurantiaca TaxID=2802615 RepID=A0A934X1H9_9BACT|nr:response regulator [Marivirga aurantiaca]MBK6267258.1 response regulator [Marivirga aurantiaca]
MQSNKVLIVEDEPMVGMYLESVLRKANYEILGLLTSGLEAINFVKLHTPDIILLDVMLEGLYDGIETSIEINKLKNIPVIYLTGLNDSSSINRAKITFPYSFIYKPFAEMELLANMELTLFKHQYELANQASQNLLSTILSEMESGVVVVDVDFRIKYINNFGSKLLNISADVVTDYVLGAKLHLSSLDDNLISGKELKMLNSELDNNLILNMNFGENKYPINNIYITTANFFKAEQDQFLIMFADATLELERLRNTKLREQQKLAAQLEGVENERARISRDLHDGIGQMLNLIKMKMSSLEDKGAINTEITHLLNQTIEETKKISNDLMPSKLREFDLQSCLFQLCETFKGFGVAVDFNSNLKPKELEVHKINIYRIVQEAFNNSLKHAHAKKISLQIYKDNSNVQITIEDDGIGFDTCRMREGNSKLQCHGLVNIKDRVNAMHGEMDLNSDSQFGTSIIIHLKGENYA